MRGIILAGGSGTRLAPVTNVTSKQLLPIYDKPMIYYPLSSLMLAGIRDILLISTPADTPRFEYLLGDGSELGININYAVQPSPDGLAQAFIIGAEFIQNDDVALILGDNIFYGHGLTDIFRNGVQTVKETSHAVIFGYYVKNPERYGVVELGDDMEVVDIVEKPAKPKSNYAVVGLYFYDQSVVDIAKSIKPSARGELEITDVNLAYLAEKRLKVELLGRGFAWLDTGTHEDLLEASNYVQTIERRQGLKIACLEEIAYNMEYIDSEQLSKLATAMNQNEYGRYLTSLLPSPGEEPGK